MKKQPKAKYVDAFVLVVPTKNNAAYKKMAAEGGRMWMKHGALSYMECVGDDLTPDMQGMPALTFPKLTGVKKGESVWYSFITYKSKSHRDQVNKKVMAEMDKKYEKKKDFKMPFDMKKMAFGGFKAEVSM